MATTAGGKNLGQAEATEVGATPSTTTPSTRRWVVMCVGLAGAAVCLTVLFLSMRAVMEIGGACASGRTPYAITHPCPKGVPGLMLLSIFGGLIFCFMYAISAIGVNLIALAWPALFLSLGWNFVDYGINPPLGDAPAVGWLVCAVLFLLMGGVPLVLGISAWRNGRAAKLKSVEAVRRVGGRLGPVDQERALHLRRVAIVVQVVAIAVGIWLGIEMFEWATGTNVGFGMR
jgi:hypothetical protein